MKRVALFVMIGLAALLIRRYLAMRDAIADVPRRFRSPLLLFMAADATARSLPVFRLGWRVSTSPGPGVEMHTRQVDGTRVLVATPVSQAAALRPAILYIHGGGMLMGSPQAENIGAGRLARELDAVVVSPDYRLAPEHPFPAALDDCMATLWWMHNNAGGLGIDPNRIAVAGSSAGGGLSASVAQRAHDEGITLRAQVLVYPMLDDRTALRDDHAGRGRFLWTPKSNRFAWTAYLGREPRMTDAPQYAAPARRTDLSGLAPAWVGVGDLDILYDESVAYAEALKASGVSCELVTVPGMYHGADGLAAKDPEMKEFRRRSVDHLRAYL